MGFERPSEMSPLSPHSAGFDTFVTARVLSKMLTMRSFDNLVDLSNRPVLLKKVGFGKHFGQLWIDVPHDYLQWADRQDFDADVKFTVKSEISRRRTR